MDVSELKNNRVTLSERIYSSVIDINIYYDYQYIIVNNTIIINNDMTIYIMNGVITITLASNIIPVELQHFNIVYNFPYQYKQYNILFSKNSFFYFMNNAKTFDCNQKILTLINNYDEFIRN